MRQFLKWLELKIPPPLVALSLAAFIWQLSKTLPVSLALPFDTFWLAIAVAGAGIGCDMAALVAFFRARTTINPLSPGNTRALVVSGIYRYSRNPMYLGLACLLTAWTFYLGQWLLLPLVAVFVLYINRFQIQPEERILTALFGDEYRDWLRRVPRWIGR